MFSANVLGVRVDRIGLNEAVALVEQWLKGSQKRYIVTPNPEFVMLAQKDQQFKKILNQADLAICDGIGLRLADKRLIRVSGRDLMLALMKKGYKYYSVRGKPGDPSPDIAKINRIQPDLLFVGMGMAKQEKWIARNLPQLKVKVAMGVGGALDQLADPSLLAPKCWRACGCEWLWRLLRQPWRLKRQAVLLKYLYHLLKK